MSGRPETKSELRSQASERLLLLAETILAYSQRYEAIRDERAVFAFMYWRMTRDLAEGLRTVDAAFDDSEWIARLAESFAARFIKAMDSIDNSLGNEDSRRSTDLDALYGSVPKPWADVYLAIRKHKSYVLEDMLFSMMAHISYDLPLALLEVRMEDNGLSHVADYHRMNQVLASRIDEIQKVVAHRYSRFLTLLDGLAGSYDEFFTNYGIRLARSVAWYNACRIADSRSEEAARKSIEASAGAFITSVRSPKIWWARMLIRAARFLIPARRRWPQLARQP